MHIPIDSPAALGKIVRASRKAQNIYQTTPQAASVLAKTFSARSSAAAIACTGARYSKC